MLVCLCVYAISCVRFEDVAERLPGAVEEEGAYTDAKIGRNRWGVGRSLIYLFPLSLLFAYIRFSFNLLSYNLFSPPLITYFVLSCLLVSSRFGSWGDITHTESWEDIPLGKFGDEVQTYM